jgi:hypothetical protein
MRETLGSNVQWAGPQGQATGGTISNLSTAEVLRLAAQIGAGNFAIAQGTAAALMERFIDLFMDQFREPYTHRQTAAKAAATLARSYPEALTLLVAAVEEYACLEANIDDANPVSHPNVISVLKECEPLGDDITRILMDLLNKYPGMAGPDLASALGAMKSVP